MVVGIKALVHESKFDPNFESEFLTSLRSVQSRYAA